MACLNAATKNENEIYQNFDVESSPQDLTMLAENGNRSSSSNQKRRSLNLPLIASLVTMCISLVALVFAVYAAVVARRSLARDPMGAASRVFLTADPSGQKGATSLFQGTGYFARLQPMLYSRSDHKSFPLGAVVYLLGGLTNAKDLAEAGNTSAAAAASTAAPVVLNRTVAYNTYTESSQQQADMAEPRFRFCGAVLDNQLYVVGGMTAYEGPTDPHVVSDTALRYNPASNTWQRLRGKLQHPRADCCAAAVAGKLYVAGGWTTDYADTLGSVEVFDPATESWSLLPANLTLPRGDCEAAAVDDRHMLVLGGVAPDGSFTSAVEALDTASPSPAWSPRANMTHPRGDFAAELLPGRRVIVMGGETSNGSASEFAMYDVEEYMWDHDTWVVKAPLPEARFRFDTAHVAGSDRVYVFGGHPTCASGEGAEGDKQACLKVALNTTWAYFDVRHPDLYAVVRP